MSSPSHLWDCRALLCLPAAPWFYLETPALRPRWDLSTKGFLWNSFRRLSAGSLLPSSLSKLLCGFSLETSLSVWLSHKRAQTAAPPSGKGQMCSSSVAHLQRTCRNSTLLKPLLPCQIWQKFAIFKQPWRGKSTSKNTTAQNHFMGITCARLNLRKIWTFSHRWESIALILILCTFFSYAIAVWLHAYIVPPFPGPVFKTIFHSLKENTITLPTHVLWNEGTLKSSSWRCFILLDTTVILAG